jgi:hypothetical protein
MGKRPADQRGAGHCIQELGKFPPQPAHFSECAGPGPTGIQSNPLARHPNDCRLVSVPRRLKAEFDVWGTILSYGEDYPDP